jgi:pimeloyl-ACP methyl ester carboxylesterase
MDRATSFTRLITRLPDWTIISYDRRGYGRSAPTGPPIDFDQQVDDLVTVLGGGPAVGFGHSLGGDVVLAAAEQNPRLLPTVLAWEPPQPWLDWWPSDSAAAGLNDNLEPEERAEWFMRRMVGDRIWERLPSATRAQRRAEGPTLHAELDHIRVGPVFDPRRIHVPVIVGRGGRSRPHQRRGVRELAASLPQGEMVEIAGAGHGVHLSHPGELAELIGKAAGRG